MVGTWKILIADDEHIIRDGIIKSIDWDRLDMQVVAEAEDGEQAIEYARKYQIDVALVDLNMPILNGLSFIRILREEFPSCRVVVITGFDKFQYAQEAIRLAVNDYILKPINAHNLQQTLQKIAIDLSQQMSIDKHFSVAYQQITKNLHLLRERFCLDWLDGHVSESEILDQLAFLQLPQSAPHYIGVIRWLEKDVSKPFLAERDRQLYLYAIENILGEWLNKHSFYIFRNHQGLIVFILWSELPESTIQHIYQSIHHYLKIHISLAVESVNHEGRDIHISYQRCCEKVYHQAQLSPIVRRAQSYLQEHYSNPLLNLNDVADDLHISSAHLSRLLKEELGNSFIHVLTAIRIRHAMTLLDTTTYTINEVSQRVGYDNQHYFSTSFKKNIGLSPIQYRQNKHH